MSLLSVVQAVNRRVGVSAINLSAVTSASDISILQLWELANEEGQELAGRYAWQALQKEATFTTVGTQVQGTIQTITGPDFAYVFNDTMWDRTTRRPVFGPRPPHEWQQLMAQTMQGPYLQYRIRQNQLILLPNPPTTGDSVFFEWQSKYWCAKSDASGPSDQYNLDTDIAFLDERLIRLGLIWRYKKAKGLPYQADQAVYEGAVLDAITRDAAKPNLNLNGSKADLYPAILVPAGNWPISGEPSA